MRLTRLLALSGFVGFAVVGAVAMTSPASAQQVTQERLINAGDEVANWLTVHRTYDSHRYSPLDEINTDNIADLQLAYVVPVGIPHGVPGESVSPSEGTPLVEDGFMYLQSNWSTVTKIDLTSGQGGEIVWQVEFEDMDYEYVADTACCGAQNRGIALWEDQVIALTLDGRAVSIDKESGDIAWEVQVADKSRAETFTVAPLVVNDLAIFGPAGGEYGIRGYVIALNLEDGTEAWRRFIIPGPGEPGNETWPENAWQTGGGSVWQTGSFDPELNLIYWGTGNPAPQFDAEYRPGDNLYTESLLALDADTGEIVWYFQFTPNDPYDYDEVGDNQLFNAVIDGEERQLLVRAARNGYVYVLDRVTGEFITGEAYVDYVNWAGGLDPETGLPVLYNPNTPLQDYNPESTSRRADTVAALICPTLLGGKNWQPATLSEHTGLLYIPATEGCHNFFIAQEAPVPTVVGGDWDLTDSAGWRGRGFTGGDDRLPIPEGVQGGSSVTGVDPLTGETVVKVRTPELQQGLLSTAGGLVFGSGRSGTIRAFDAETLETVWEWNLGGRMDLYGPPMTFEVNGTQYVAATIGGGNALMDGVALFSL